jgi:hypothetical protein
VNPTTATAPESRRQQRGSRRTLRGLASAALLVLAAAALGYGPAATTAGTSQMPPYPLRPPKAAATSPAPGTSL